MKRLPVLLLVSAGVLATAPAYAESAAVARLAAAQARMQALQRKAPLSPAAVTRLQEAINLMRRDQGDPALFALDARIFDARAAGVVAERQLAREKAALPALERQVEGLQGRYEALRGQYGTLQRRISQQTMTQAQEKRLEQEVQQQKQTLAQVEKQAASLANREQQAEAGVNVLLARFAKVTESADGKHLQMPVAPLFGNGARLLPSGTDRLRAIATLLQGLGAVQMVVRVSPQPGGPGLATERAEAMLHALRADGISGDNLSLATGVALPPQTAEILLLPSPNASAMLPASQSTGQ